VRWARDGGAILAIDTDRQNVIVRVPIDGGAQSVVFDGRTDGFDDCGGRLVVIYAPPDCPTCSAIGTVTPGAPPHELARVEPGPRVGWVRCDPSGTRAVYVARAAYTMGADVWMVSLDDGTRTRLTDDGKNNLDPVFTADGRAVLYSSTRTGQANLWELPLDGGAPRAITSDAGPDLGPAPSPDGRTLFFDLDVTSVHLVADRDGERSALTTEARELIGGPSASVDGAHVAFVRSDGPAPEVELLTLASGERRVIGEGNHAAFSPDGRELIYAAVSPPRIVAVPVAGGAARELAALPGPIESLAIGSDARVHVSVVAAAREAWSVELAGGALVRDAPAPIAMVVPGPDGERVELTCEATAPCHARLEPGDHPLDTTDASWGPGGVLYACAHHTLTRFDATGAATGLARECGNGFALSPDGRTLYTGAQSGHVRRMAITNFADR
jgi:dipeptidyl aminopeptidase/acylaminoacyl peptidase